MQRRSGGVALFLLCALFWAATSHAVTRGQPLALALEELRKDGLALIFSSALIGPDLTVNVDPGGGTPEEIARRILAPYGLGLQSVRASLFSVVKLPERPPSAAAVGSRPD